MREKVREKVQKKVREKVREKARGGENGRLSVHQLSRDSAGEPRFSKGRTRGPCLADTMACFAGQKQIKYPTAPSGVLSATTSGSCVETRHPPRLTS